MTATYNDLAPKGWERQVLDAHVEAVDIQFRMDRPPLCRDGEMFLWGGLIIWLDSDDHISLELDDIPAFLAVGGFPAPGVNYYSHAEQVALHNRPQWDDVEYRGDLTAEEKRDAIQRRGEGYTP